MPARPRKDRSRTTAEQPGDVAPLQQILEAVVDPVRRSIVCQLYAASSEMSCGAFELPVSPSTATHHFKVLREAGIISQRYAGTSRMNTLRHEELETAYPGLLPALVRAVDRVTPAS